MRYLLIIIGISALLIGLFEGAPQTASTWMISGVICLATGIAAVDIINAGRSESKRNEYPQNLRRFEFAVDSKDKAAAVKILKDRGIDEETAESAVASTIELSK